MFPSWNWCLLVNSDISNLDVAQLKSDVSKLNVPNSLIVFPSYISNLIFRNLQKAPAELGFGGFKQSGIGKENGTEFISQFTRLKCKFYMNDDSKILEF